MSNLDLLDKFEALQMKKAELDAEKTLLERQYNDVTEKLKAVHTNLTPDNLETNIEVLEKKLAAGILALNIPEEYLNELSRLDK